VLSVTVLLGYITAVLDYVGHLPYGPDTNGYPAVAKKLASTGHYIGYGYYKLLHTSAVLYSIMYWITTSYQYSYTVLVSAFALCLTLMISIAVSRILGVKARYILGLAVALYLLSPGVGYLDLLQQCIATLYNVSALTTITIFLQSRGNLYLLIPFTILTVAFVVTHITPILLAVLLVIMFSTLAKKRMLIWCFVTTIVIAVAYTLYATAASGDILGHLLATFKSLVKGTIVGPIIRAYEEVPQTQIGLLSWSLLPAINSSYIMLTLWSYIRSKVRSDRKSSSKTINVFLLLTSFYATILLLIAFSAKFATDISRYFWVPAYTTMYFSSTTLLAYATAKCKRPFVAILLLLLMIVPYAYSIYDDPGRNPQVGELRLAPITYWDRIELLPLAVYSYEHYYVVGFHDVRIPIEFTNNASHPRRLISMYYPKHDMLLRAAVDEKVEVPRNTYLIPHKGILKTMRFNNYNVVLNGREHVVLLPAW